VIRFFTKKNPLTQDPNDYVAVVFQSNAVTEATLARNISQTVGGVTVGQVAQIIDAYHKCIGGYMADGVPVKTGLFSISFSVGGTFSGPDADFNPVENFIRAHALLNRAFTNAAKGAPKTRISGVVGGPIITAVVDLASGEADNEVHPGTNARIVGNKIKLLGPASAVGLFFLDADGEATEVPVAAISVNNKKIITFIVPNLPAGVYTVKVITQYNGSAKPSDIPLSYTFPTPITVPA
jgi:hypothetical protein